MSHSSTILRNTDMPYTRLQDDNQRNSDSEDVPILNHNAEHDQNLLRKIKDTSKCYSGKVKGLSSEEVFQAIGYRRSIFLCFVYHFFSILSFGCGYLLTYWRPTWRVVWTKKRSTLSLADTLILKDVDDLVHVVEIKVEQIEGDFSEDYILKKDTPGKSEIHYFIFQYLKYVWNTTLGEFECLVGLGNSTLIHSLRTDFKGYTLQEQILRSKLFGKNCISMEVKSYAQLLFLEILNPFYIFQIASLILWSLDEYYLYAFCIFFISCLSIGVSLFETRKQNENLKSMVEASNASHVTVMRLFEEMKPVEVDASSVVPGDVIVIPSIGGVMVCDAVLISGNAIVNESMLTGESIPVTKTSLTISEDTEFYSPEVHKRHTLFCGTNVIQTRYYGNEQVLAVVVRTGFGTAKGELVRSILYPRPIDFKFYKDSLKFILFMFFISMIGMGYSLYIHITRSKPIGTTIVRTLDIVTIVVPPALPAAMTIGTYYAQSRLKALGIFCISPPRINICGKLKLVCFDKTGTLTEEGLEVWGVVEPEKRNGNESNLLGHPCHQIYELDPQSSMMAALATCHSLTYINGKLTGDPLDVQMFEATRWDLVEPEKGSEIYNSLIPTLVRPSSKLLLSPHSAQITGLKSNNDVCDSATQLASGEVCGNSLGLDVGSQALRENVIWNGDFKSVSTTTRGEEMTPQGGGVGTGDVNSKRKESMDKVDQKSHSGLTIEQIISEISRDSGHWKEIASTVVKPSLSQTSFEPIKNLSVAETSFQVPFEIGIIQQFPFSSSMQRMSVIVRVLGHPHMEFYCKGAPEVVQMLCKQDTIPENLSSILTQFTVQGFRVIALAHKKLKPKLSWHKVQQIKRDEIECDMTFLGLLILQNVLKPETTPVITQLKEANIRTVMVTGDNILTGICVARDCGMVDPNDRVLLARVTIEENGQHCLSFDPAHSGGLSETLESSLDKNTATVTIEKEENYHLAISGTAWSQIREHFPEYIPYIVSGGTIFARMSPDQKVQVVEELQELQYVVGMCGDGANDCGALKAAHVGISLSEAEASVAAPFTSHVPNITCVPKVICEGRGALATNFSVFKYMALYSIIQFVSILILYSACTNLSDPQFLYIDLFIVTLVTLFMGYTKAKHKLVPERPLSNLIGSVNMFSVLSQIAFVLVLQVFAYFYLIIQPWYEGPDDCSDPDSDNVVKTWATNVIFCVSSFQYLSLAIIYSPGHPFRKPFYTNFWLVVTIIFFIGTTLWLLMYPAYFLETLMQLKTFPDSPQILFRSTLLALVVLHLVLGWSMEYFIVGSSSLKKVFKFLTCKKQPKNLYKRVQKQIAEDSTWPPTSQSIYGSVS